MMYSLSLFLKVSDALHNRQTEIGESVVNQLYLCCVEFVTICHALSQTGVYGTRLFLLWVLAQGHNLDTPDSSKKCLRHHRDKPSPSEEG